MQIVSDDTEFEVELEKLKKEMMIRLKKSMKK